RRTTRRALTPERRRRDPGLAADPVDEECHVVDVAPVPVLARLERADERVRAHARVRRRMPVGRRVAAANVTAREADAEVQPLVACPKAVLAAVDRGRQLEHLDLVEVRADGVAHVARPAAGTRARCACTSCTAIEPSPTAVAQRLAEPERTSPA